MSRTLIALEQILGVRLLYRTSRSVSPTTAGVQVLARARQVLADAANLLAEATTGHTRLRIGHAWSAMGQHTLEFQRRWAALHPEVELHLVRTNSPTGGLAEGLCDLAVVRIPAAGEPVRGGRRRPRTAVLRDSGGRPVGPATHGTAHGDAGPHGAHRPAHRQHDGRTVARRAAPVLADTQDIDDWLALIAAGRGIGITPESTVHQYRREGVVFRAVAGTRRRSPSS